MKKGTQREELINNKSQVKTKRHKNDCLWQHDQTKRLIDLWSREECLYNVKNQEYFDGKMLL